MTECSAIFFFDVALYCRSCHVCQVSGKPSQVIPPAPLHPIPAIGEPFEHVIVDCVGPLPKTKAGYQYILTIMCAATRFPEAIPLRSLRAKAVVKALVQFFSTFGLPKHIQTDQGSNFLSRVFAQVMSELSVKHRVSSAYHPETQGALERFHQTLKAMLRKYCVETDSEWDVGLPLLLFAIREATQESLGFSPAELVFGHTVRGPLRLLQERRLADQSRPAHNVLDYVSSFRERLHAACELARSSLSNAQSNMKERYDRKTLKRTFLPGEHVLVFLPVVGSCLQARFSGPYEVERQISDTYYLIKTPDRSSGARLENSKILEDLKAHLFYLDEPLKQDIYSLICGHTMLFSDKPTQTTVLEHDIDVGDHRPIKQHTYRVNPVKRAVMKKEVEYLLKNGFAVPSFSPWSSPTLLVPKSDETPRFCNDYHPSIHPHPLYPKSGRGGSSLSREAQTSLSPATSSSSSGGTPRRSQASREI
uniref:Integrase catalytic domain-containing protein n=1 Tax=Oreochromis aureus TaxID=47969 RepID=A0AAZ1Y236_OREAU